MYDHNLKQTWEKVGNLQLCRMLTFPFVNFVLVLFSLLLRVKVIMMLEFQLKFVCW